VNPEPTNRAHDQFVDELLDAALRQYGRTEPRSGLEQRILHRLEERPAPVAGWFARWQWPAGALATAAILAIAFFVVLNPETSRHAGKQPAAVPSKQAQAAAPGPAVTPEQVAGITVPPANRGPRFNTVRPGSARGAAGALVRPGVAEQRNLAVALPRGMEPTPKLAMFPTPTPLTGQETLLARVAAAADQATLQALASASHAPPQDLSIPELKIQPLEGTVTDVQPGSVPKP
jgi:hypothetical protein